MRRRLPDSFVFVVGLFGLGIALFIHLIYEDLLKSTVLKFFGKLVGATEAEVFSRLTEMSVPLFGALALMFGTFKYFQWTLTPPAAQVDLTKLLSALDVKDESESTPVQALTFSPHVHTYSASIFDASTNTETGLWKNLYYVMIGNNLISGASLKRVRMRIYLVGDAVTAPIKDEASSEIDIRHGETASFEIGALVSRETHGHFTDKQEMQAAKLEMYMHNLGLGYHSFDVESAGAKRGFSIVHSPERPFVWPLFLIVSADDVVSLRLKVSIDLSNLEKSIRSIVSAD